MSPAKIGSFDIALGSEVSEVGISEFTEQPEVTIERGNGESPIYLSGLSQSHARLFARILYDRVKISIRVEVKK